MCLKSWTRTSATSYTGYAKSQQIIFWRKNENSHITYKTHVVNLSRELAFWNDKVVLGEKGPWSPFIRGRGAGEKARYYWWMQKDNTFPNF